MKGFHGWAMLDSGATSTFINRRLVDEFKIPTKKLKTPRKLRVIDGRDIASGQVTEYCALNLEIFGHNEVLSAYVVDVGKHDLVLGMSWLSVHNPTINFKDKSASFNSEFCAKNCLHTVHTIFSGHTPDIELASTTELPTNYQEFAKVFAEEETSPLPPHRPYDIQIDLKPDARPRHGPIYSVGVKEDEEMRSTIQRQLEHGLIRPSKSPMASPVIFVKKKNGKLRMCIDYRRLNDMTVKNVYPLPRTNDLVEKLRGAKIFTKLDLKWGYNLVRIREGDEWKTAFKTKYGLFEYLVMPFGLTNAPATFQHFMNDILRDILDIYVIVYLDDILIFSKDPKDHPAHVKEVLSRLKKHNLYCNLEKCFFDVTEIDYLGLIVSPEGIRVDQEKVTKAVDWKVPHNVKSLQEFLGFVNFYRKFIPNYSAQARALFDLLCKDTVWNWGKEAQEGYEALKQALKSAPLLIQPDPSKQFYLETDASDFATGGVLSQIAEDGKMHPIAFLSKSSSPAERNYDIYNKELLAVIKCFKEWRHLLEGTELPIQVLSDHKNLGYFQTTKELRGRLARWANFLADFNFQILYRPGAQNKRADLLSRKEEHRPEGGGENSVLLPPGLFVAAITPNHDLDQQVKDGILEDPRLSKVITALRDNEKVKDWEWDDGFLRFKGKIYVPNDKELRKLIMESRHNNIAVGHPGQFRTYELVSRKYIWSSMKKSVNDYVSHCESCIRNKHSNQVPPGLLNPIELPLRPWEEITYDLITQLPESEGFDAILTVVDRLSKMVHFIPTTSNATAIDVANLFVTYVWKLHGLPKKTISDRGPNFNSKFLRQLYKRLDIKPSFSTAYRPQTDGQSERANQVVEGFLRHYVSHRQDNWVPLLPMAEFSYNNGVQVSTGKTPFFACYGFHPQFTIGDTDTKDVPAADERADWLKDSFDELRAALETSNQKIKEFYDRKHRAPVKINVGDKVFIDSRDIQTDRPSRKLAAKRLGPFQVLEKIGTHAFKLKLPHTMKVHPVFHVSKVLLKQDDPYQREPVPLPPVITPEGEEEFEVENVLNSKKVRGVVKYLIKWKGYGPADNTWEPLDIWYDANRELRDGLPHLPFLDEYGTYIRNLIPAIRNGVKQSCNFMVPLYFKLKWSDPNRAALARSLTNKGDERWISSNLNNDDERFKHPIIRNTIENTFFRNSKSFGNTHLDDFTPLVPIPTIAYACSIIRNQIKAFESEKNKDAHLNSSSDADAFMMYMKMMEKIHKENPAHLLEAQGLITEQYVLSQPKLTPVCVPEMNFGPNHAINMGPLEQIKACRK
ncbi:hypothetical protein FRC09_018344 [Ceratobasidium sp. 395]|nr:hypothetical protein FRC09_018344 [Ceratobasidium sp. 395]